MDSTLVIKKSHTYCKNLQVIKTKHYVHAPRGIGWQEKTIARPRPPLIRKTINKHLMLRLCYITVHHTCMLRDSQTSTKVFLKFTTTLQHDSNITISISQNNHQASNFSQYSILYMKVFTILGCLAYQDYLSKLPCYLKLSK